MGLLLVPYNNAMRLGQGFNSYTQQICIDDAVIVDPERAENVITNDGTTMRIIAEKSAAPSAWSRQTKVVIDNRNTQMAGQSSTELERDDTIKNAPTQEPNLSALENGRATSERGEKPSEKLCDEASKAVEATGGVTTSGIEDWKRVSSRNEFADRCFEQQYTFDSSTYRGLSQTVTYTSRFVDRLSDVTEDMCVSGSLSIKAGKIGGSGKGSFIDSDKFKESDLNFYISVKVANQTVNFKDALLYNPVKSINGDNFKTIFGDSFISGFVEGGEFNALVSMKILNKAKKTDIQAEAKVALTAGPVNIEAESHVGIARSNLETNTETTIQVAWSGGGQIKPMEQQWDIHSLMQAATRFPDLVAHCPQRVYAILTKYETLRSFVALKPDNCTPLQYENAQIYTNALLDHFMSYKALYKQLGEKVFRIQGKTLEIMPWPDEQANENKQPPSRGTKDSETGLYPYVEDLTRFEASIKGLSDARNAIRRQMVRIVREVDLIERHPAIATDEDHKDPFQASSVFETRIPTLNIPEKFRMHTNPLTGRVIQTSQLTNEELLELKRQAEPREASSLYSEDAILTKEERDALDELQEENPRIGATIQITSAVGSGQGKPFNNLEIVNDSWIMESIRIHVYRGAISYIEVKYKNGLSIGKGAKHDASKRFVFESFSPGEKIIAGSIETGICLGERNKNPRVLALGLVTNRGKSFLASAPATSNGGGKYTRNDLVFEGIEVHHFDCAIENGTLLGFLGRSGDDNAQDSGIWRLGLIWARSTLPRVSTFKAEPLALDSSTPVVTNLGVPQSGTYSSSSNKRNQPKTVDRIGITFDPQYKDPPLILAGLVSIQGNTTNGMRTEIKQTSITQEKATFTIRSTSSPLISTSISWLAIPRTGKHIETGVYEFAGDEISANGASDRFATRVKIPFGRRFSGNPKACAWLCGLISTTDTLSVHVYAVSTTDVGLTLELDLYPQSGTADPTGFCVGWLAWDETYSDSFMSDTFTHLGKNNEQGHIQFSNAFNTAPVVFTAIYCITYKSKSSTAINTTLADITTDGFAYKIESAKPVIEDFRLGYRYVAVT